MFGYCVKFVVAKSLMNGVRRVVLNEMHKKYEPILREKLGFSSIHEYMIATPEEIRQRQNVSK